MYSSAQREHLFRHLQVDAVALETVDSAGAGFVYADGFMWSLVSAAASLHGFMAGPA
jgi:hypothetical protein